MHKHIGGKSYERLQGVDRYGIIGVVQSYQNLILVITIVLAAFVSGLVYYTYCLNLRLIVLRAEVQKLQESDDKLDSSNPWSVNLRPAQYIADDSDGVSGSWILLDSNSRDIGEELDRPRSDVKTNFTQIDDAALMDILNNVMSDVERETEGSKRSRRSTKENKDKEMRSSGGHGGRHNADEGATKQKKQGATGGLKKSPVGRPPVPRSGAEGDALVVHYEARPSREKYHVSSHRTPVILPIWHPAANVTTPMAKTVFQLDNTGGVVTVKQEGLYWVYAQVVYHDTTKRWAFGIYVNEDVRVKCINTEQNVDTHATASSSPHTHSIYQHCYTATMIRVQPNDRVSIRCLYGQKTIVLQPEFTFWGLVRFASTTA